jgi:hypothetical protein
MTIPYKDFGYLKKSAQFLECPTERDESQPAGSLPIRMRSTIKKICPTVNVPFAPSLTTFGGTRRARSSKGAGIAPRRESFTFAMTNFYNFAILFSAARRITICPVSDAARKPS